MTKLKVATIVGTRPEIIRLSRVTALFDQVFEHVVIHTGQNYDYELNQIFYDDLGLRQPDYFLEANGSTASETIAAAIKKSDDLLRELRPDAVLVLGDTNSCLSLIAAKRLQIPTFHLEAGNRCFDQRVPEEINRRILDHLADINLAYSDDARSHLLSEGLPPDMTFTVGSPMKEVLDFYAEKIDRSTVLENLDLAVGGYYVVSIHREENVDNPAAFTRLLEMLNTLAGRDGLPVVVSTHPRTRKRLEELNLEMNDLIQFLKPLAFTDYVQLQKKARVVLSDSGTISEESSLLGFPALNLRETHERHEAMEAGAVAMVGSDIARVEDALRILEHVTDHHRAPLDYQVDDVSERVAKIVTSYTGYVNRVVWRRF